MTTRRFGPRFNNNTNFANKVGYDPAMDPTTWNLNFNPSIMPKGTKKHLCAIGKGQGSTPAAKRRVGMPSFSFSDKKADQNQPRREAEERLANHITNMITALRFNLTEINECPTPTSNYRPSISIKQVTHAILQLERCLLIKSKQQLLPDKE